MCASTKLTATCAPSQRANTASTRHRSHLTKPPSRCATWHAARIIHIDTAPMQSSLVGRLGSLRISAHCHSRAQPRHSSRTVQRFHNPVRVIRHRACGCASICIGGDRQQPVSRPCSRLSSQAAHVAQRQAPVLHYEGKGPAGGLQPASAGAYCQGSRQARAQVHPGHLEGVCQGEHGS